MRDGMVNMRVRAADGSEHIVVTQHVIAGTGYKVDMTRLSFLSSEIRRDLQLVSTSPALSTHFESSVPGLYFVGLAAANTFGPLMRFAFGAEFAAQRVAESVAAQARKTIAVPAAGVVAPTGNERSSVL